MSNIRLAQKDDIYHAWLSGDLNITSIGAIKDAITEVLGNKPRTIIINFNEVEFIDSSAIAVMVSLLKSSISKSAELVFYDLRPDIQNIFEVACLDKFFNIISNDKFKKEYEKKIF